MASSVKGSVAPGQSWTLCVVGVLGMCGFAQADTIGLTLGLGNPDISGYPAPYAEVLVDRTSSTTAKITFTGDTTGGYTYRFGANGAVGVNVNATSWTIGSFDGSGTDADLSSGGAGNEDGWGSFNQTVDNFDGFGHSHSSVSFILTNTSGSWASASAVLTPNASGYLAAAHIFVVDNSDTSQAAATGYATGSVVVPLPAAVWSGLTLLGGTGFVGFLRKRKMTELI